ncbi:MAG: lipid-A-disaccharide synthase [Gemmatimonadota bacterium]|nr:MAG: lipid-A-disaccharide synthase [Gemmatimonadota bacterium]
MRVFMSAGEASGDAHGASVIEALRSRVPDLTIEGIGGPRMVAAGLTAIEPMESPSVVGLVEAIRSVPVHVRALKTIERVFRRHSHDVAVLIDYPGFHLKVAAAARRAGVPVLYYIAPQLWAWGAWRAKALRRNVRSLAVVLPFEEQFFRMRGIAAEFVGHPLLDRPPGRTRQSLRNELHAAAQAPVLGLFPGSRPQEVARLWPAFRDAANMLRFELPGLQTVVAGVMGASYAGCSGFEIWEDRARDVMILADVAVCKSGTTTLEAVLAGTPMVVAYRMHGVSYAVARRAVKLSHVSLVNLLAARSVVTELLQHDVTAENLADALRPLLDPASPAASDQRRAFEEIRDSLGTPGASRRVAQMACRLVA